MNTKIYSFNECLTERIEFLCKWKDELKANNTENPQNRRRNFEQFKMNCRNRKHDAIAGRTSRNGLFSKPYWEV